MYKIFERLLKEKGLKVADVTRATGIASSTLTDWKKGRYTPKDDKLRKIADYLGVTTNYLRTGEEETTSDNKTPEFTPKEERDIQKELDETLNKLEHNSGLMFDGEALDEHTKELLKESLEFAIKNARRLAKEKYTPKKYRKNNNKDKD